MLARRSFMRALGLLGASTALPSGGEAGASLKGLGLETASTGTIAGSKLATGTPLVGHSAGSINGAEIDAARLAIQTLGLPAEVKARIWRNTAPKPAHKLDADLLSCRSFSLAAKQHLQRQRDAERGEQQALRGVIGDPLTKSWQEKHPAMARLFSWILYDV